MGVDASPLERVRAVRALHHTFRALGQVVLHLLTLYSAVTAFIRALKGHKVTDFEMLLQALVLHNFAAAKHRASDFS
jgi:hypothetical protein